MTKYAVTIGTNYEGAAYQLAGCVTDADDWSALLLAESVHERVERLFGTCTEPCPEVRHLGFGLLRASAARGVRRSWSA